MVEKEKDKKEAKEVRSILKDIKGKRCKVPQDEKDIINWDARQLNAYIKAQTSGMSIKKKLKFADELIKRIQRAKQK